MVESKAKAILLPGFQVMDIGYQQDGTYLVILSGKVRTQTPSSGLGKISGKAVVVTKGGDLKVVPKVKFEVIPYDARFIWQKLLADYRQSNPEPDRNNVSEWLKWINEQQKVCSIKMKELTASLKQGKFSSSFVTELDGSYVLENIPPGKYWIDGRYGFGISQSSTTLNNIRWCVPFEIKAGESLKIDLSNDNAAAVF
jgi:hypothetical protein